MTLVLEQPTTTGQRRLMRGTVFNFRVTAAQTNNAIVVADYEAIPGSEPPRHVHSVEDEVFLIREGSVTFFIGDEIIEAGAGDVVHLPVNVPHHFIINSPIVKGILVATPGHIENFFRQLSVPYSGNDIPAPAPPTPEQMEFMAGFAESFGMKFA